MRHLLDSDTLACGWLAARTASSKNKDIPATNRTVLCESYKDKGVRLVSTDGQLLIAVWVPDVGAKSSKPPATKPDHIVVAADLDGRGNNLCGYLRSLAARLGDDDEPLTTVLDTDEVSVDPTMLPGMSGKAVVFDHPGKERVELPTYDGEFPDWRALVARHKPTKTGQVDVDTELLGRLGKLSGYYPGYPATFEMGGAGKPMRFDIAEWGVSGLVMSRPAAG